MGLVIDRSAPIFRSVEATKVSGFATLSGKPKRIQNLLTIIETFEVSVAGNLRIIAFGAVNIV
jgi:hypothetical protein